MPVAPIEEVIAAIARGEMVILVDDENRENEGDLCMAAEFVTPEAINFMAKYGRGLICLALTQERLQELEIPMMVHANTSRLQTAFTVSIEAREGVSTGISAGDRARTIQVAVDPAAKAHDLVSPGHIFPLAAKAGGVLARVGQTEGSVDLARMAGCRPAGVICEIMNDDGSMARMPDLELFAREHGLLITTIEDIIAWRLAREGLVREIASRPCPIEDRAEFTAHVFCAEPDGSEHLALCLGEFDEDQEVLVRVHAENLLTDVFNISPMAGASAIECALDQIEAAGAGVLLYIRRPNQALVDQLAQITGDVQSQPLSPAQEDERLNTPPAALRQLGIGAQCLRQLGVRKMRLLSDHDSRYVGLSAYGLELVGREGLDTQRLTTNRKSKRAC